MTPKEKTEHLKWVNSFKGKIVEPSEKTKLKTYKKYLKKKK